MTGKNIRIYVGLSSIENHEPNHQFARIAEQKRSRATTPFPLIFMPYLNFEFFQLRTHALQGWCLRFNVGLKTTMLNWLRRKKDQDRAWVTAVQPPNEAFPFPKGMKLRAKEVTTIALPKALIGDDETIGSVLHCDEDAEFGMNPEQELILVRLQPGMTMSLSRSSEAILVASDGRTQALDIMPAPHEST
jgi:hypothetical protein